MQNNQNQFGNKRLAKLAAENTGLNECRADMSDVSFEIGKSSYTAKLLALLFYLLFSLEYE